jgi:hypothetical protein
MVSSITTHMSDELQKRQSVAAVTAFAFSLALHVGLFLYLADFKFAFATSAFKKPMRESERAKVIKLMDVRREAVEEKPRILASKLGDTMAPVDVSKEADTRAIPPDKVAIQPPPLTESKLAGEKEGLAKPSEAPPRTSWDARQEILEVDKRVVADGAAASNRRRIPRVERVSEAPDVVVPVDTGKMKVAGLSSMGETDGAEPARADIAVKAQGGVVSDKPDVLIGEGGGTPGGLFGGERATNSTPYMEKYLTVDVHSYSSPFDFKYVYLRIEIKRAGAEILPVIPKDVVLVQDSSNSMAEQRLHFCREGLARCLAEIGPQDRFNVVRFREKAESCFPDWSDNKPEAVEKARKFIEETRPLGNTDILASIRDVLNQTRQPGRPAIALVITDGRSTTGTTDSSEIIGQFSKMNDGAMSIFTIGTVQTANSYFLDLLSYCNRGDAFVVATGRWAIPDAVQRIAREFSRPVLSEVRFRFAHGSGAEVYPVLTSNLYLDRPLVMYGRIPKGSKKLVFQAVGKAMDINRDMVFDLDLDKMAKPGDRDIRETWAKQKVYHLIGEFARRGDTAIRSEIAATAQAYKLQIPYKGKF